MWELKLPNQSTYLMPAVVRSRVVGLLSLLRLWPKCGNNLKDCYHVPVNVGVEAAEPEHVFNAGCGPITGCGFTITVALVAKVREQPEGLLSCTCECGS